VADGSATLRDQPPLGGARARGGEPHRARRCCSASWSRISRSTGSTARTTRSASCGASTPCTTARSRWIGSRDPGSTSSS
jgi:hypothetical protein